MVKGKWINLRGMYVTQDFKPDRWQRGPDLTCAKTHHLPLPIATWDVWEPMLCAAAVELHLSAQRQRDVMKSLWLWMTALSTRQCIYSVIKRRIQETYLKTNKCRTKFIYVLLIGSSDWLSLWSSEEKTLFLAFGLVYLWIGHTVFHPPYVKIQHQNSTRTQIRTPISIHTVRTPTTHLPHQIKNNNKGE